MQDSASNFPAGLYRTRDGVIFGVCQGIAEWRDLPVIWIRLAVVLATFLTGFWPGIVAYVFAAIFMKPKPAVPFEDLSEQEFYDSFARSKTMAVDRLKKVADALERRTRRLESIILDRERDWDRRFDRER